ncbi:anti-sigma-K factor RskA [Saccharothrix saharensis]|uniref:Regulator of SigK n=1 Tax=Saccharothrix saharensis TaxID=571190 RepID=A0A543J7L7_9PSEU|nr:anti-sigma factor [Saccharothrix saharensis]TQM78823.1 anti-sigma-K factor RskA [Saccharothrix saharensis]
MTGDTTRHDAHTLIGAYVLDAVSDAERRLFEEHLAGCPTCAQETAELLETTAVLAGETAVEPPAHLRDKVLASVAATPQLPPATTPTGRTPWVRRTAALAAAAGIVVAVVLGVQAVDDNRRLERDLRALAQVEDRNRQVAELLAAPDAELVRGDVTGGGTGTVVASAARGQVLFLGHGLARLPEDRDYQLWLIGPDGPRPAGLLRPSGEAETPVLASGFTGREAVGLTVEPRGGSPRPTSPTVVVLPLV